MQVILRGTPEGANALADCLRAEGLEVTVRRRVHASVSPGDATMLFAIAVGAQLTAQGVQAAAKRAIEAFREQEPEANVRVEDHDESGDEV